MMRQLKIIFALILIVINIVVKMVSAAPSDDLSNTLARMNAMQANFVQTTFDNRNKPVQISKGMLALVRPGKFRWHIKQPIPQLIIANGDRLWIIDPDLKQVTIRKVRKELGETPTMLLSENLVQLDRQFIVSVEKHGSTDIIYTLKPKKKDSTFLSIQLRFKNNRIVSMRLADQLGHQTQIDFSDVVENPTLKANLFQYKPSIDMDVINEK